MKKILSILSAGLLAIFAVSCVQEQLAMFDASKASAPVLQSFTVTDDDVTIDFTPGSFGQDFNQKMPVNHSVILKSVDGNAVETVIPSTVKDGKIVISVTNLSKTLMGMGYAEGQVVSLEMAIRASMQEVARDNRRNGFTESAGTISIPNYEIYIPTGDPYGRYTEKSPWGLVGSFNDWGGSPDVEMWTNGTLHVVKGVTLEAGTEVKFRKDSSWDVNLGYADGVSSYTLGEEFALAPGGANIVIAETGRYDMIIDVEGQTCKIIESVAGQEDPYAAYKEVSPWSVIGSFNSWGGDVEMVTNGTLHVCKNITFAAGDEFKFRKDADWGTNFGYADGVSSYTLGEEFSVGQDGANIVIAESGAYDLFLDPANATAKIIKTQAVTIDPYASYKETSPWSVIGSFNSWGGDVEMVTNGTLHVAKAVAFTADTEWKFRKDADWAVNFGYAEGVSSYTLGEEFAVSQDGGNIKITEDGVYDLILDPENATAKIIASVAVEQPEPPAPEEKPKMWSLIGTLNGTGWDTDFDMSNTGGDTWMIRSVKVTASDEFKIRADHDWAKSVGGPEENSTSTISADNPYGVFKPELGKAFEAGDKNIQIGKDGLFDVTYDYAAKTILIEEHVAVYSLIGMINGTEWNTDFAMSEKNGVWTSEVVKINGGFKIRYDYSWADENTYGADAGFEPQLGVPFTATQPGSDIKLAEGSYKVQFTPATKEVVINAVNFPEHLYMIGAEFGGWDWNSDGVVEMVPVVYQPDWGDGCNKSEAQFWTVRYFTAGEGFKFCSQRAWNGDFWGLDTNEGFVESGGNCTVTESGFYLVHVDLKRSIVHVEPARVYGMGNCFGGWNTAMEDALFKADGKKLKATVQTGGELRMYVESAIANSDWWTREFIILDGKIDYRGDDEGQGDQARVNVLQNQVVVLDFNAGTGEILGEGQEPEPTGFGDYIYAIGGDTGWSACYPLRSSVEGGVNTGKYKGFGYLSQEFKFKPNEDNWDGDWEFDGEGKIADNGGANCPAPEASYYMIEVDLTAMTYTLTPVTTIGIVGPAQAGGWDADTDMTYNAESGAWEATVALSAGEMKFRANDDWGINWGGALDALTQGGNNIAVEAGTYAIKLFAWCDGKAYATMTAQ